MICYKKSKCIIWVLLLLFFVLVLQFCYPHFVEIMGREKRTSCFKVMHWTLTDVNFWRTAGTGVKQASFLQAKPCFLCVRCKQGGLKADVTEFSLPCCAKREQETWLASVMVSPKCSIYSQNFSSAVDHLQMTGLLDDCFVLHSVNQPIHSWVQSNNYTDFYNFDRLHSSSHFPEILCNEDAKPQSCFTDSLHHISRIPWFTCKL